MNVRKEVYLCGALRVHMVCMVLLMVSRVWWRVERAVLRAGRSWLGRAERQPMAEATRGPECRTISMWTSTKPASEEEGSRPCSKARIRRTKGGLVEGLVWFGGVEGGRVGFGTVRVLPETTPETEKGCTRDSEKG